MSSLFNEDNQHASLNESIEHMDNDAIQSYIEGSSEISTEGFIGRILARTAAFFGDIKLDYLANKRVIKANEKIHLGLARELLEKISFVKAATISIKIDEGFKGNRARYSAVLNNLTQIHYAAIVELVDELTTNLEQVIGDESYDSFDMGNGGDWLERQHQEYLDFVKHWFKGLDDSAVLADLFDNNADVLQYLKDIKKYRVSLPEMKTLSDKVDKAASRMNTLSKLKLKKQDKRAIQEVSNIALLTAKSVEDMGKLAFLTETDINIAGSIFDTIKSYK